MLLVAMCRAGGVTMLGRHATETRAAHSMLAFELTLYRHCVGEHAQSGTGRKKCGIWAQNPKRFDK